MIGCDKQKTKPMQLQPSRVEVCPTIMYDCITLRFKSLLQCITEIRYFIVHVTVKHEPWFQLLFLSITSNNFTNPVLFFGFLLKTDRYVDKKYTMFIRRICLLLGGCV
ncbi:hypothetical protein XENTR_v10008540 [Xenopus tropicalis]|nr:hypothetical protein XENTR_v10008540 [Xenopus tropicalis]